MQVTSIQRRKSNNSSGSKRLTQGKRSFEDIENTDQNKIQKMEINSLCLIMFIFE